MSTQPTEEEIAAALAAVRLFMHRRSGRSQGTEEGMRWMRAGRVEALLPPPASAGWATVERPR